jgi:hypothetical protein
LKRPEGVPAATSKPALAWLPAFSTVLFSTQDKESKAMCSETGSLSDNARNPRPVGGAVLDRLFIVFLVILPLVLATGCGDSEKRVPVFPVSGTVTYQGKPPVGAQIVLHLANSTATPDAAPIGVVQDDGSFKFTVYDPGDGAPQGDYVATVQWFKLNKEMGGPGPNVIPKKYTDPKTSPIKVTVTGPGPTAIPPITIANN